MSHDIESDFVEEYHNEEKTCPHCDSYEIRDGQGFCKEFNENVPPTAHCDFFRSAN